MKLKVLVIDDSALIRSIMREIINSQPDMVLVGVAPDPIIARELIKQTNPDVLTLDVEMPGMSGLEALPLIRDASPKSKVVMVTGNADKTLVQKAVAGGAKGYILKPLRPAHVEAFMKKLLA